MFRKLRILNKHLLISFVSVTIFFCIFPLYSKAERTNYKIPKEAKTGFYFDKTDSSSFIANHARMILSLLAYNLVSFLKQLLPAAQAGLSVGTLRLWLFKIAGKIVHSGRKIQLKLSYHHVYRNLFYQLLARIQALS